MARGFWPPKPGEPTDVYELAYTKQLNGICFSGGGIRSATFNLGVLQGLAVLKKLNCFDYLSTVSGGGYIHQFFASWIECESLEKVQGQLNPLPGSEVSPGGPPRTVWPDPIRWLRRYSNYLTPSKGLLTTDTWAAISIWSRNTMLNQIVLISALFLFLLLPTSTLRWEPSLVLASLLDRPDRLRLTHACALRLRLQDGSATDGARSNRWQQSRRTHWFWCRQSDHARLSADSASSLYCLTLYLSSAFWNGTRRVYKDNKPPKLDETIAPALALQSHLSSLGPDSSRILAQHLHSLAHDPVPPAAPAVCCAQNPSKPADAPKATSMDNLRVWQTAYSFRWWVPSRDPGSTSIVFLALLIGIAFVVPVLYAAIPPRIDKWELLVLAFIAVLGVAYLLLHLARLVFFYLIFFVPN